MINGTIPPNNPQQANHLARNIKSLLYTLYPAYPNLKYVVIVGGDQIVPFRRIQDKTLIANERTYGSIAEEPTIVAAFDKRYVLTDDYYVSPLPMKLQGREIYLPQYSSGRLVESPLEIAAYLDAFQAQSSLTPADAFVTGYDFLLDQATAISNTLAGYGVGSITPLINNTWTADDVRNNLFALGESQDLISLNSHFQHYNFFPNTAENVFATEVTGTTDYNGSLVFSVGCHAGLNVADAQASSVPTGTDWAQSFLRQGAAYIGSTGFAYGDSDLISYSELLMVNFVNEMGSTAEIGQALIQAKQNYYNSVAGGSFSSYDEKVLAEMTLYGLPMFAVNMPNPVAPEASLLEGLVTGSGTTTSTVNLNFS